MTDDTRDPHDGPIDEMDTNPPGDASGSGTAAWNYGAGGHEGPPAGDDVEPADHDPVEPDMDPGTWHDGDATAPDEADVDAPVGAEPEDETDEFADPPPEAAAAPEAPQAEVRTAVVVGPTRSGKTVHLLSVLPALQAWGRRSHQDEPWGRRWWIEATAGEGTQFLAREGVRTIIDPTHAPLATSELRSFEFSVSVTEEQGLARPLRRTDARLRFFDGPGGHVVHGTADWERGEASQHEYEQPTIDAAREAHTMVLTVDASNPEPEVISGDLSDLIGRCCVDVTCPPPQSPWLYRLLRRFYLTREQPPGAQRLRRLPCANFLLLLTKVDRIVSPDVLDTAFGGPSLAGDAARLTPLEVAELLDPVGQAIRAVGRSNLLTILNALRPEARFGIGACSAWGFNQNNGLPFMNSEGTDPVLMSVQERSERVKLWTPFGVQDALRFMVTGHADGTVVEVTRADLQREEDPSAAIAAQLRFGRQVAQLPASDC